MSDVFDTLTESSKTSAAPSGDIFDTLTVSGGDVFDSITATATPPPTTPVSQALALSQEQQSIGNQALSMLRTGLEAGAQTTQRENALPSLKPVGTGSDVFRPEPAIPAATPEQRLMPTAREAIQIASNVFIPLEAAGEFATKLGQDIVSKIAGDPQYGGNLRAWVENPEMQSPAERFIAKSAKDAPTAAFFANLGKQASEMSPMLGMGAAPGVAGRLVSGGFAGSMGLGIYDAAKELNHQLGLPSEQQDAGLIAELKASLVSNGLFGALAAVHSASGTGPIDLAKRGFEAMKPEIAPKAAASPTPYRRPGEGTPFPMAGEPRADVAPTSVTVPYFVPQQYIGTGHVPAGQYKVTDDMSRQEVEAAKAKAQAEINSAIPNLTPEELDAFQHGRGLPERFSTAQGAAVISPELKALAPQTAAAVEQTTIGVPNASSQQSATSPDGGVRTRSELGQLPEGNVEEANARLRINEGEIPSTAQEKVSDTPATEAALKEAQAVVQPENVAASDVVLPSSALKEAVTAPEQIKTTPAPPVTSSWERLLQEKTLLEQEAKRRSMIYQHDAKIEAAELLGVPTDTFLNLPYEQWSDLSRKIRAFKDAAEAKYKGSPQTTLGQIWKEYASAHPEKLAEIIGKPNLGGSIESKSAAEQAKSSENNSLKAFAEANGVKFETGDTPETVMAKINAASAPHPPPTKTIEQPKIQGLGGAIPEEFEQPGSYVSNMFAAIDRDRAEMGKPPMEPTVRRTWDEDNAKALALMNRDPNWIPRLIEDVSNTPRPLLSWEQAGMVWHRAKLKGEYNNALQRIAQAFDDDRIEDLEMAKSDANSFENALQKLDEAVGRGGTGSEAGRSLRAQRIGAGDDFSLVEMTLQKRKAKGGAPLTDTERAEVKKQYDEMQAKNAELERHLAERDAKIAELEAAKAIDQIQKEAKREPTYAPQIMAHAKRMVESLRTDDSKAVERLKAKFGDKFTGLGGAVPGEFKGPGGIPLEAQDLVDLSIVGAREIAEGATRAQWDAKMAVRLGDWIKPYLDSVWESSNKHLDNELARIEKRLGKPTAEKVVKAVKKADLGDKIQARKDALAEKIDAAKEADAETQTQSRMDAFRQFARGVARDLVESGITDREALIDRVHEALKEIDPEVTRREAMDAISGYGDFKELTKDEVSMKLRDLKGQMQQLGKLEDMASGKAPLKTGIERRSPSDIERALIKQVNEAKKKGGFEITDPSKQLATALTARKTYYRNRLADLKQEISTRERIVKQKSPVPTDPELEAMKAEYATLKEEHAKIFGDRKLTDEQRLKMALAGVERQIAEYERRIKAGDFTKKAMLGVVETPALKAAKARRDALKEQFNELRDLDEAYNAERRASSIEQQRETLQKQITALESKLQSGQFEPQRAPVNRPADPMLEPLKQRRDELNRKLAEARKKPESQKYAERLAKQLEQMQERIAEKEAAIASRQVAPRPKPQNRPLSTPELEQAKQRLEELNRQISEIRHPKKSATERAVQAAKTRMATQIADLTERIAKSDYQKRPRTPTDLSADPEAMMLKGQLEKIRRDFKRGLEADEARRWSPLKRTVEVAKEVLRFPRQVLSAYDLSAVLRQGGVISFSHPIRAAKSFIPMMKALKSDANALAIEQQILNRPNATNGNYSKGKLYLAPLDEFRLSAREELMQSRFGDRFPGVRLSNRAFVTFLNKLRADSFDAMLAMRERWFEKPVSEAEMKLIGNYINIATGRGDMGKFNAAAEALAIPFFSPRLVLSRFQLLTGQPLRKGIISDPLMRDSHVTKAMIAFEYSRMLAGLAAIYGLAQLAGAEDTTDPRSSDFGKIKFGNTRIDPMAGLGQATVLFSRLATGETVTQKGKVVPIRGDTVPYGGANAADLLARFLRTKLSPVAGAAVDVASGKNVVGEPVSISEMFPHLAKEGIPGFPVPGTLFTPLSFRDIYDIMVEQGVPAGTAIEMLNILGMGVQYYEPKKPGKHTKK